METSRTSSRPWPIPPSTASGNKVASTKARLENVEKELAEAYKRWDALEALKG